MNVNLVMFKSDGTRRDFPLKKERTVVGRTNDCDLRVPLTSVSRQHCEIVLEADQIKLRDLGSSNGTFQNDTRVQETVLKAGDEVGVGPVVFTVVVDGEPANIPPVRTAPAKEAKPKAAAPAKPAGKKVEEPAGDEAIPVFVDDDSPTVDLDDPIAALEAMGSGDDSSAVLPALTDDEDETPPKKK